MVVVAVYLLMVQCGGREGDYERYGRLAGISEDNALCWKVVLKISLFPSKLRSSASCSFFGQSFSFGHYPSIHQQVGNGFIYFKTLRIISQSERKKDCSCTFYGFFIVCLCWIVNQHFISLSLVSAKGILLLSMTVEKFCSSACSHSFLGLYSVKTKSDDWYQIWQRISSDNHRPILNQVVSFIQWEPEEIVRWVIRLDILNRT